ncbi:MAG: GH92 family glycosyl hydrolase [Chloracidobacterium sp.]|nr:GH92 family glycosyl hydrolase [Chloracidobacterium sp.]
MNSTVKNKRLISISISCLFVFFVGNLFAADYAKWVNPFIGTGGHGHTFPGATMPFGMVQLSPDTRIDNWDGSSGYHYSDDTIFGFSHTHLSGTGIPDYCDILFMPTVGEPQFFAKDGDKSVNGYASKFSHANEKAEPGYYSVKLDDDRIVAELTATTRVGLHRYSFPTTTEKPTVILDLVWRDKIFGSDSKGSLYQQAHNPENGIYLKLVSKTRIEGYRRSSSWARDQIVYFVAEFSKPFYSTISAVSGKGQYLTHPDEKSKNGVSGNNVKAAFQFDSLGQEQLLLKVAISSVSIEGARKNLAAELPGWDFDKVRADAKAAWNKELSKIEVSGGTDAQTTNFYTALYHTMIQPNVFNDVDGGYRGLDGKTHSVQSGGVEEGRSRGANLKSEIANRKSEHYTVFSLWDTFRAAHPLYTIIDQKRTVDFINTFIRQYEQGGRLPVWELWGNETDCMIGYHAVSVIADAMAKGIKGFDYEKAYAAAKHSAELDHFGLAAYKKRGYISMEDENESVSRTLEYAYDDWCIARMAEILTRQKVMNYAATASDGSPRPMPDIKTQKADYENYSKRSRYFENLFDKKTGFFRPKKNGGFVEPFAPNEVTFGFTEGNSWQYSFFVPHDVTRLEELMGGREKFVAKLDELFTTEQKLAGREQADLTGLIGQYAHGNEPSHHIAYLYNYAQQPWKTQKIVRQIMDEFYKPTPDGLIGNEDCGQMSAWYILSASGFYPVAPGNGVYAFGTPLFPEMTYRLENGKTFTVRAKNVSSANKYILNAKLNGAPYKKALITHEDLMRGGVLEFAMIDQPVTTAFTEFPVSATGVTSVSVPVIEGKRTFTDKTVVSLSTTENAEIMYTVVSLIKESPSQTKKYSGPFTISENSKVEAYAKDPKTGAVSFTTEANFIKQPNDWTVKVISPYSTQYTGGGDNAIVDGIRGTTNFASGEWQGVQGKTYEAVVDLQRETEIKEVGASFLQVAGPWIWMPANIKFEISNNGTDWTQAADIKTDVPQTDMTPTIREFKQSVTPVKARYVRLRAYNFGKIPSWHLGAGGDPWIFIDEVIIN